MSEQELIPTKEAVEIISKATGLTEKYIAEKVLKRSDAPKPKARIGTRNVYYKPDVYRFLGIK